MVSAGTVDGLASGWTTPPALLSRQLDPGSYYAPQRLLVLRRSADERAEPDRIAIDHDSFDHEALTLAQFPPRPGREYRQLPYPEVPAHVLAGAVDAGVWHMTASAVPLELAGLRATPMVGADAEATRDRLSGATLLAWAERPELRAVVEGLSLAGLPDALREGRAAEQAAADRLAEQVGRDGP